MMKTKEQIREYRLQYYQKNKEGLREYQRLNRKLKREEIVQYQKEWKKNNSEKHVSSYRRYRDLHENEVRKRSAEYNKNHPEIQLKTKARWLSKNKEYISVVRQTLFMIEKGEIQRTPCQVCGEGEVYACHLDRVDPTNIIFLCKRHFWERKKQEYRAKKDEELKKEK